MFDVGFSELILLAIVALVVLGPEKLPHAARVAGAWVGRIRRTVSNMQAEIEREVSAQEMRERLQKEIDAVKAASEEAEQPFQAVIRDAQGMQAEVHSILPPAVATGAPIAAASPAPVEAIASNPAAPVSLQPSPEGEAVYREWLAHQKSTNLRAPDSPEPTKDAPAS